MGESIIIEPIKRWLRRNLRRGRPHKQTCQDDQFAYIRDAFELTDIPVANNLASSEEPDGGLDQLDSDLVKNVFGNTAPSPRETVKIDREEYDESSPMNGPTTKVSADAVPEDEDAEANQGQTPSVRSISSEVTRDSVCEALDAGVVEETHDDVERQEELSNLVDQTLKPEAPDKDDSLSFLSGDLKSVFKSKVSVNPHTKRLNEKHGTVGAHELVNDLRGLTRSIEKGERR
jgi:hypothetical protein